MLVISRSAQQLKSLDMKFHWFLFLFKLFYFSLAIDAPLMSVCPLSIQNKSVLFLLVDIWLQASIDFGQWVESFFTDWINKLNPSFVLFLLILAHY